MKYWYDTEFVEDGRTINLLSIGVHANDGRSYYAVVSDADWEAAKEHHWVANNVLPYMPSRNPMMLKTADWELDMTDPCVKPGWVIRNELTAFFAVGDDFAELWADYGAYDHIALMQLWGTMMEKPVSLPMYTNDIQQLLVWARATDEDWNGSQAYAAFGESTAFRPHHALYDAFECRAKWEWAHGQIQGVLAEDGMAAWQKGYSSAMQSRNMVGDDGMLSPTVNGSVIWALARQALFGDCEGSTGDEHLAVNRPATVKVTKRELEASGKLQVRGNVDGSLTLTASPASPTTAGPLSEGEEDGQQQGREEGLRVPEPVRGVPSAPEEGAVEVVGSADR